MNRTTANARSDTVPGSALSAVLPVILLLLLGGCTASVPSNADNLGQKPVINPDYSDLTIPPNIAPLNFEILTPADEYLTVVSGRHSGSLPTERVLRGKTVVIPEKFWKELLAGSAGGEIHFTVYARTGQTWQKYQSITNTVSPDRIDPWLTYRRIDPGYVQYGRVTIEERCIENFKTKSIFDNAAISPHSCANCHHARAGDPNNALFHVRQDYGGTMLRFNGKLRKINTVWPKSGFAMSYPSWHPTLPLIAYSSNNTRQTFHSRDIKKIEVLDNFSDLMLYDIEKEEIIPIFETEDIYESFPAWSNDGKTLYYCVAEIKTSESRLGKTRKQTAEERLTEMCDRNREIHYSLMKMDFDSEKRSFSAPAAVFDAKVTGKSYVHPRVSPDGRFLVYVELDYGTFPLTHKESELMLLDLATGQSRPLEEINTDAPESFHSWDTSGRWMVFSTRRANSAFTRTYFTHFAEDGTCTKPFLLPQRTPDDERADRYSHNLPELLTGPVPLDGGAMARAVRRNKAGRDGAAPRLFDNSDGNIARRDSLH